MTALGNWCSVASVTFCCKNSKCSTFAMDALSHLSAGADQFIQTTVTNPTTTCTTASIMCRKETPVRVQTVQQSFMNFICFVSNLEKMFASWVNPKPSALEIPDEWSVVLHAGLCYPFPASIHHNVLSGTLVAC